MAYATLGTRDTNDGALGVGHGGTVVSNVGTGVLMGGLLMQLRGGEAHPGVPTSSGCDDHPELDVESDNHSHRLHNGRAGLKKGLSRDAGCTAATAADPELEGSVGYDNMAYDNTDGSSKVDMQQLFSKISARLLPLFFVMVIMCYVDRTSLAFAAIQLNADLGFSPTVYGMGSGLFFLGYSLFQIPSNLLLRSVGGPIWLATIIAAWGVVASAFASMSTPTHFYMLRLLLGATEAGAFPGMWYVLTTFFPGDQITFPFAVVEAGISLSHVVAAPLAAACLSMNGLGGLAGWRWLFLLEGLPTLVLAVVMYRLLPRSPDTAHFLTATERRALMRRIELQERSDAGALHGRKGAGTGLKCVSSVAGSLGNGGVVKRAKARGAKERSADVGCGGGPGTIGNSSGCGGSATSNWNAVRLAVTNKYVWYMGALKFVRDIASFGIIFWAPTIVNALLRDMRRPASSLQVLGAEPHGGSDGGSGGAGRLLLGGAISLPSDGHGTGTAAVLLTALPFALAAAGGMALAHSSQRTGERILHVAIPYIVTGAALSLYSGAASRSPWLGFMILSLGVVGVYCGSGPCLALLSELAAGPGLVVALPLYNSLGTMGGFLGPTLVGWLVQRAYHRAEGEGASAGGAGAIIRGGGFGVSAVVLGTALCLAGVMVLILGVMLGRLPGWRDAPAVAGSGAQGGSGTASHLDASLSGGRAGGLPVSLGPETQLPDLVHSGAGAGLNTSAASRSVDVRDS